MLIIIIEFLFFSLLLLLPANNKTYRILIIMQAVCYFSHFLVGNTIRFDTMLTLFNVIFVNTNLFLIIYAWSYGKVSKIVIKNFSFLSYYEKNLNRILVLLLVASIIVFVIVRMYLPDIAELKLEGGYKDLYETVPFFGILFRFISVVQALGYLSLPFVFLHLQNHENKKALKSLILSASSLVAGLAMYSRASILNYTLIMFCSLYYLKGMIDSNLFLKFEKYIKYGICILGCVLIFGTISRFSSSKMDYYGDRIPQNSYIKDPILFSLVDYASQGYINGINQLERYNSEYNLKGEQALYNLYQLLSFFHIMNWDSDTYEDKAYKAYNLSGIGDYNGKAAFHGYTCRMVNNFGYLLTLLVDLIFFIYVKRKTYNKSNISFATLSIFIFLMMQSISSIFYMLYNIIFFPIILYYIIRVMYLFRQCLVKSLPRKDRCRIG